MRLNAFWGRPQQGGGALARAHLADQPAQQTEARDAHADGEDAQAHGGRDAATDS